MKLRRFCSALFLLAASQSLLANDFAVAEAAAVDHGKSALDSTAAAIVEADLRAYVTRLASPEYEGRGTGDRGEAMATAYLATFFDGLGLRPAGEEGGFYQKFDFRTGMKLEGPNALEIRIDEPVGLLRRFEPRVQYEPLSISTAARVEAGVVFAGFGIEAKDYNSFEGLEVEGKWLLVLRGAPKDRKDLERFGPFVAKANRAKAKGAAGVIFVRAGNPAVSAELIPPTVSVGGRDAILPAVTITDRLAATLLTGTNGADGLKALFEAYSSGERVTGHPLPWRVEAEIGIRVNEDWGRNVLGRLMAGEEPTKEVIMIGAHIDHLGHGNRGGSRAQGAAAEEIHFGADDNASGVAAMMELAQYFADQKRAGTLSLQRDLIFAGWSGEEMGLFGSKHFVEGAEAAKDGEVRREVTAYLNLDMVGRAAENGLTMHGTASSKEWEALLDSLGEVAGLEIKRSASPYLPTDSTPFYEAGVPILAAFTGLHDDYHMPSDTVDKIDFAGMELISRYLQGLTLELAQRPSGLDYVKVPRGRPGGAPPKVRIGLVPEEADGQGVRIAQIEDGSPAAQAGLQDGDLMVSLNGDEVRNVQGLIAALQKLKAKTEYAVVVKRGEETVELKLTPEAR